MGSGLRRARRFESAISVCLLAIVFFIGLGVFVKQFDMDMSRFGIPAEVIGTGGGAGLKMDSFIPEGFGPLSAMEVYNPENLYEKINGKAPLYINCGFKELYTRRFVNKEKDSLWMELFVYDMALLRNAFSVYSVQKRAGVELLPIVQFAYKTSNGVYFVHGKYYVEIVGSAESVELFEPMAEVAQKIISKLVIDKDEAIEELDLFPRENLVAGSFKLYQKSAFGFEGLTDTFAAKYKFNGETITAFLIRRSDPQEAQKVAESYYKFLLDNGGVAKTTTNETLKSIASKVVDFYGTTEIVFAIGPFVGGVHEAENQQSAEKLAEAIVNKLGQAAQAIKNE